MASWKNSKEMGYSRVLNAISPGVPSTMNMREQNRLLAKVLPNPTAATTKYVPQPFLPIILGEDLVLPCQLHDLKVSHSKSWHPSLQVSVHWVLVSYLRMMWFFFSVLFGNGLLKCCIYIYQRTGISY